MFCDIHTHYLPGVDHGCSDEAMALTLVLQSADQGTTALFATAHSRDYLADPRRAREKWQTLQSVGRRCMKLYLGCEVRCSVGEMAVVLPALEKGEIPSMNGTRYVLTEFSKFVTAAEAEHCVRALLGAGWKPVIAHAERYPALGVQDIRNLKALGCRVQINTYSLEDSLSVAWDLVEAGLADFLGSDAHSTFFRPPSVRRPLELLKKAVSQEYYDALTWENAREAFGLK